MEVLPTSDTLVEFWRQAGRPRWYSHDRDFDAEIARRFGALHAAAGRGELSAWEATPTGSLALVICLDQFSRNLFRNDPRAFANDTRARAIADRAIARGFDAAVASDLRAFFYLPFMHSEDLADQQRCVALFAAASDADGLKYAVEHRDIIARFHRFPHRNGVLGRAMTSAEQQFLDNGGFKE